MLLVEGRKGITKPRKTVCPLELKGQDNGFISKEIKNKHVLKHFDLD
jgi:hypothetical protein